MLRAMTCRLNMEWPATKLLPRTLPLCTKLCDRLAGASSAACSIEGCSLHRIRLSAARCAKLLLGAPGRL